MEGNERLGFRSASQEQSGEKQECGDHADGHVAQTGQLGQGGLASVPGGDQGEQQHVNDHQVDAQGPDQAVLERADGEADAQDQAGKKWAMAFLSPPLMKKKPTRIQNRPKKPKTVPR